MVVIDSSPGVLAVSQDAFIVVTLNIFTVIGLKIILNEVGKMFSLSPEVSNFTLLGDHCLAVGCIH